MFSLNEDNCYLVCLQGVDLRKSLDGLCGVIRYLRLSPANGNVYVFLNKNRTTMKLLHWERGGFVIYYKRMESGRGVDPHQWLTSTLKKIPLLKLPSIGKNYYRIHLNE